MYVRFYRGGLLATLLAGPIFLLTLGLAPLALDAARPLTLHPAVADGAVMLPIAAASIVLGSVLAVMPVWLGGTTMGWIAARNPGLAHPAFWSLVGAAITAAAAIALDFAPDTPIGFALIATGAICATIVRYGTRWSDESAPLTPHAINACAAKYVGQISRLGTTDPASGPKREKISRSDTTNTTAPSPTR